jgi:2-phosphoglycerate kinase
MKVCSPANIRTWRPCESGELEKWRTRLQALCSFLLAAEPHCYLAKVNILIMIFLLGGPPRVGKSIISSEIRQKHAVSVVSTDTLGAVLENVLSPEAAPDLFVFGKFNENAMEDRVKLIMKDPAELIDYVRKESYVVWKAVVAYIRRENNEGRDVLIEGVAVLPELISQLEDIPHRVVFIGNQGVNHKENIKKFAEVNEHDWMRGVSDEYLSAFAMFVKLVSAYIEREAKKYGFEYIEMDNELFGDVTEKVMKSLELTAR